LSRAEQSQTDVSAINNEAYGLWSSIEGVVGTIGQSYESAQGFCELINAAQMELDALIFAAE